LASRSRGTRLIVSQCGQTMWTDASMFLVPLFRRNVAIEKATN
jgi:hypothetical protein